MSQSHSQQTNIQLLLKNDIFPPVSVGNYAKIKTEKVDFDCLQTKGSFDRLPQRKDTFHPNDHCPIETLKYDSISPGYNLILLGGLQATYLSSNFDVWVIRIIWVYKCTDRQTYARTDSHQYNFTRCKKTLNWCKNWSKVQDCV